MFLNKDEATYTISLCVELSNIYVYVCIFLDDTYIYLVHMYNKVLVTS